MDALALLKRVGVCRGRLPAFTSLGGYPLVYYTRDMESLCADCATADYFEWLYAISSGEQWAYDSPTMVHVYWEGPDDTCANCNKPLPSAYGDPNE